MAVKTELLRRNSGVKYLSESLTPHWKLITETLISGERLIRQKLPFNNIRYFIGDENSHPNFVIPGFGTGGNCYSMNNVTLNIDQSLLRGRDFSWKFTHILAHELNHAARWQEFHEKQPTLFESMVRDGLADQFATEISGRDPKLWTKPLSKDEIKIYINLMRSELNLLGESGEIYRKWFFSRGKNDIPHWLGYRLGFYIVGEYLKDHPELKPSQIYDKKAEEFRYIIERSG